MLRSVWIVASALLSALSVVQGHGIDPLPSLPNKEVHASERTTADAVTAMVASETNFKTSGTDVMLSFLDATSADLGKETDHDAGAGGVSQSKVPVKTMAAKGNQPSTENNNQPSTANNVETDVHYRDQKQNSVNDQEQVVPPAYLFSAFLMTCTLAILGVMATLIGFTSAPQPIIFDESLDDLKKPAPMPPSGFMTNMPSPGSTIAYLLCWAFPVWVVLQLGYWGMHEQHSCQVSSSTAVSKVLFFGYNLGHAGSLNEVTSDRPISWVTIIASGVTMLAAAIAVKIGLTYKEDSDAPPQRSALLDNAKIGAITFIIFGHILWYNTTGEYHDKDTWFSGSKSVNYFMSILEFNINSACFLSGCVMRRPVNLVRLFNLAFDLLLPCLLWTYILKGFLHANFENPNWEWKTFTDSLSNIVAGNNYRDEWYLQALIVWRLFSYFTGMLNVPVVFASACLVGGLGGYNSLVTERYNLDTACGFLLMFTFGMLCPLQKLTSKIPSHFALRVLGLAIMFGFPVVIEYLGPLPDNHLPYNMGGAKDLFNALQEANNKGSCLAEFNMYWTRRVLKNIMALIVVLAYVLLVVPRHRCMMSALGKYCLYPYLFHEYFNFARDRLVMSLDLPVSTDFGMHFLFYSSSLVYSMIVFFICACPVFRWVFSPFLEFGWLKARLLPSGAAPGSASAPQALPRDKEMQDQVEWAKTGHELYPPPPARTTTEQGMHVQADLENTEAMVDGDWRIFTNSVSELTEERKFHDLPRQKAAEKFYKLILISGVMIGTCFYIGFGQIGLPLLVESADMAVEFFVRPTNIYGRFLQIMAVVGFVGSISMRWTLQMLRLGRLQKGLEPAPCEPSGLLHCVVICSYKEPLSVLRMTIGSLAKQTFETKKMHIVLATESRDPTASESFRLLQEEFGAQFGDMYMTVHTLCKGEIAGKSSNENHAVRELYKKLAPEYNPYRVMITICDVDSLFAPRYIEQLDWSYQQHANPSQLIYDGPLNTYRNYFEADIVIRTYESLRCQAAFSKIWDFQACQSNYSLTLGMCREINFWCPDNTPEDLHTTMKTFIHTHGSMTVAPVWSLISNDLVSGWKDRYIQAKRHSWGVTESMWALTVYKQMPTPTWIKMFIFVYYDQVGQELVNPTLLLLIPGVWYFLFHVKELTLWIVIGPSIIRYVSGWVEAVVIEYCIWFKILPAHQEACPEDFPQLTFEEKAWLWFGWLVLPITSTIGTNFFGCLPRLHCLLHSFLSTQLAYITAPKAQKEICRAS